MRWRMPDAAAACRPCARPAPAVSATSTVRPPAAALTAAAVAVGGVLWAHNVQHVVAPVEALRPVAVGLLALYVALTFARAPRANRVIAAACAAACAGLLATGSPVASLYDGAAFALVFMGFLPAIAMIRAAFETGPHLGRLTGGVTARRGAGLKDGVLALSHVTGAVLTLGTFAVVGPALAALADEAARRDLAVICLRGMCLAILWTPFTVAMGFAGAHLPQVPLWQAMACGAGLAAAGLLASLGGGRGRADLAATFAAVRPALAPVAGAAGLLVAANALTGLGTLQLIIVLMPPLCLAYLAAVAPAAAPGALRRVGGDLGRMGGDMLLFGASIAMGFALKANPLFAEALAGLGLERLAPGWIAALLAGLGLVCALAGLHVTVTATIILAVAVGLDGALAPLAVFLLVLFAWSAGAMLSMSSLAVAVGARTADLSPWRLILSPNLGFCAALGAVLAALIGALHWVMP